MLSITFPDTSHRFLLLNFSTFGKNSNGNKVNLSFMHGDNAVSEK
jgi:hypothetical protein